MMAAIAVAFGVGVVVGWAWHRRWLHARLVRAYGPGSRPTFSHWHVDADGTGYIVEMRNGRVVRRERGPVSGWSATDREAAPDA